ncbi:hypothetical protein HYC85_024640 [Camellia sinensis]|uniref:Transmembrane protein n=1 Tax=Camellia sinensis TaxID=4442 RepID=A0A7J7GCL3_CAMSI|nr:hypothetical protein HYC85_024640 [Camellia sinensis]
MMENRVSLLESNNDEGIPRKARVTLIGSLIFLFNLLIGTIIGALRSRSRESTAIKIESTAINQFPSSPPSPACKHSWTKKKKKKTKQNLEKEFLIIERVFVDEIKREHCDQDREHCDQPISFIFSISGVSLFSISGDFLHLWFLSSISGDFHGASRGSRTFIGVKGERGKERESRVSFVGVKNGGRER